MRVLVIAVLFVCACAKAPDEAPSAPVRASSPASEWLGKLRVVHAEADGARSVEARTEALATLRAIASEAAPAGVASGDAAAMRRDLYGRAGRLALDLGRATDAQELTRQGLLLEGRDPFRTQLHLLAVEAQRALGNDAAVREAEQAARAELQL